jgi:hypothetical protein
MDIVVRLSESDTSMIMSAFNEDILLLTIPPTLLNVVWVIAGSVEYRVLIRRKRMADKNGTAAMEPVP